MMIAGEEYLVLQPSDAGEPFTVKVEAGTYQVDWLSVDGRETVGQNDVTAESSDPISFIAPFDPAGPAVLYLKTVVER